MNDEGFREVSPYSSTINMLTDMMKWYHQFNKNEFLHSKVDEYQHKVVIIRKYSELGDVVKKLVEHKV